MLPEPAGSFGRTGSVPAPARFRANVALVAANCWRGDPLRLQRSSRSSDRPGPVGLDKVATISSATPLVSGVASAHLQVEELREGELIPPESIPPPTQGSRSVSIASTRLGITTMIPMLISRMKQRRLIIAQGLSVPSDERAWLDCQPPSSARQAAQKDNRVSRYYVIGRGEPYEYDHCTPGGSER